MSPAGYVTSCGEEECTTSPRVYNIHVSGKAHISNSMNPLLGPPGFALYAFPVLSLKSCVEWESGNGTATNPYEVSITSSCSSAVN